MNSNHIDRNSDKNSLRLKAATTWLLGLLMATAPVSAAQLEHVVVHRDPTMYYIAPSLTQMPDGDLIVGVREAYHRPPGRRDHVDPTARGVILRSRDGGNTFGEKLVVDDHTESFSQTQSMLITPLRNGDMLATFFTWGVIPVPSGIALERLHTGRSPLRRSNSQVPLKPFIPLIEGSWTKVSSDGGKTWSKRRPVDAPGIPPLLAQSPVVEMPDGALVFVGQDYNATIGVARDWTKAYALRSVDGGETWQDAVVIGDQEGLTFREPSLVLLEDGRLMTMMRTQGSAGPLEGFLHQSFSSDGGRTWSAPAKTPMWGWPAHVLELADGRLFCSYGYRREPFGVRATLSHDGGRTWDHANEMVLRDDGGVQDLGYPTAVQLPDGRIFVTYYINHEAASQESFFGAAEGAAVAPGAEGDSTVRYLGGTFITLD